MAFALLNAFVWAHSHDFSADSNELSLDMTAAALDANTFGSEWRQMVSGVKSSTLNVAGYWEAGADSVDARAFADFAVVNRAVTIGPSDVEGDPAYIFQAAEYTYSLGGAYGDVMPFSLTAQGTDPYGVVKGRVAAAKQLVEATGPVGAAVELGAVTAGKHLYGTLHVFGAPGTTITVQVQSDVDADFADPTTRATIGPLTTAGGVWVPRVSTVITDTFYRLNVSALTGAFTIAGALAVR